MSRFKFVTPAVSVAALLSGSAAFADVTAQQVWDDWKTNLNVAQGVTVGSEATVDGVLTVTDLGLNVVSEDTTVAANLAWITFTENGDGTVTVEMAEDYPITITGPNEDGTTSTVKLALQQKNLSLDVSGTPEAMTYDIAAKRYSLELLGINDGTRDLTATGSIALNNVAGSYTVETADMRSLDYEVTAASLDILADVTNPDDGSVVNLSGKVEDLSTSVSMQLPLAENTTPETMLVDGLASEGGYTFGASTYIFSLTDASGETNGTATASGGAFSYEVSNDNFGYDSSANDIAVTANSPMMPFPVTISLAEYGINLNMPMSKTEEPADFAFGVNLTDLTLNDEIWAMVDPGSILPRDPATMLLDLSGTATLFYDLVDPKQMEALNAAEAPGEINSIDITDLNVTFAGAQVTGKGAFTFDNTDMTTFGGMPRPEGMFEVAINGVNGLMGKLTEMGLLPGEQAQMAGMMIGMFGVAVGDDQLTSKIEIGADGAVMINGNPMPM